MYEGMVKQMLTVGKVIKILEYQLIKKDGEYTNLAYDRNQLQDKLNMLDGVLHDLVAEIDLIEWGLQELEDIDPNVPVPRNIAEEIEEYL